MSAITLNNPKLEPHFKTLEVGSLSAYKLWCYRNGLDTSTEKTPDQLQAEIDLFQNLNPHKAPDVHQRHNPKLAKHITRIFDGKLQNANLSHIPYNIRTMYNRLNDKPDIQQALCQLILHVEKYGDLIRPIRATKSYGTGIDNTFLGGIYRSLRMMQYNALRTAPQTWHASWTIAHGPLGDSLKNDDFWETVVQFIGAQNFLARSYVNAIVDYIRHQKYAPQRIPQSDGTFVEGPPTHPNFCMKGRSANKLLRLVDEWHQELTGVEDVELQTWEPSGFEEFEHVELDPKLKRNVQWSIHELVTSQQLFAEGRIMHHCAGSYAKRCAAGEKSVWSLRALDLDAEEENQIQEHVLTIEVDNKKKAVVQNAGKFNLKPFGKKIVAKQRKANNVYLHLLRQSPTYMRMWMDREGLSHG